MGEGRVYTSRSIEAVVFGGDDSDGDVDWCVRE